jgi:hypothetical protein
MFTSQVLLPPNLQTFFVLEQTVKINGKYQVAFSDMILCGTIHYCEQAQATFDDL